LAVLLVLLLVRTQVILEPAQLSVQLLVAVLATLSAQSRKRLAVTNFSFKSVFLNQLACLFIEHVSFFVFWDSFAGVRR